MYCRGLNKAYLMSNVKTQMSNQIKNSNVQKKFDLAQRTVKFGEDVVMFASGLSKSVVNMPLINQLVRSGTSIGANYMEADGAESKKDFLHKIGICKKEAKETCYWFQIIAKANAHKSSECRILWKEAHELTLIFSSITLKVKNKK